MSGMEISSSPAKTNFLSGLKISVPERKKNLKENIHMRTSQQKVDVKERNDNILDKIMDPLPSMVSSKSSNQNPKTKLKILTRSKGGGVKNPLPVPQKDNQNIVATGGGKRVRKVQPQVQGYKIDCLDPKKVEKNLESSNRTVKCRSPSDSQNDFESPNLLNMKLSRRKVSEKQSIVSKSAFHNIHNFASPDDEVVEDTKKKTIKCEIKPATYTVSKLKEFQYQFLPVVQLWSKLLTLSPHLSKIHTFIPRKTYKMMVKSYKTI